ncbi:hypothetical protein PRZ48_012104 [Zasmidium cellare]|uniref:Uncharacterized protein n=1 Tax=Zasmidium cellare TaxID=395010 RepID=A0ABR0E404_ZASCE|nr:hypothetical protein PRZ48_012104 [Zasmidium cellare]
MGLDGAYDDGSYGYEQPDSVWGGQNYTWNGCYSSRDGYGYGNDYFRQYGALEYGWSFAGFHDYIRHQTGLYHPLPQYQGNGQYYHSGNGYVFDTPRTVPDTNHSIHDLYRPTDMNLSINPAHPNGDKDSYRPNGIGAERRPSGVYAPHRPVERYVPGLDGGHRLAVR